MFKPCSVLVVSLQCIQVICKEIITSQRCGTEVHVHSIYMYMYMYIMDNPHPTHYNMYIYITCICTMKMPNNTLGTELIVGVEKGRGKEGGGGEEGGGGGGGERGTCIGK